MYILFLCAQHTVTLVSAAQQITKKGLDKAHVDVVFCAQHSHKGTAGKEQCSKRTNEGGRHLEALGRDVTHRALHIVGNPLHKV